jgi:hypothetical protein
MTPLPPYCTHSPFLIMSRPLAATPISVGITEHIPTSDHMDVWWMVVLTWRLGNVKQLVLLFYSPQPYNSEWILLRANNSTSPY